MKLWIARDKNGFIGLYRKLPTWVRINRFREDWDGEYMGLLDKDSFPEVTLENSPQEIELKLKSSSSISESIVKEFMDTLNFTYDKSETCMTAKIYNSDLISLKNIINSRLG